MGRRRVWRMRGFNSRLREEATADGEEGGEGVSVSTHASVRRRPSSESTFGAIAPVSTHASVRRRRLCIRSRKS